MCPAVPTTTLFVLVGIDANARSLPPPGMLLEERIGGQTATATLRLRSLRQSLVPPRAGRPQQESAGQPPGNPPPREWLLQAWPSALDRRAWKLPIPLLAARPASR